MRITPELVAKLIFAASQLRYFEQQLLIDPNQEMHAIVIRYQCNLDDILCKMGVDEFISRKTLIETITLEYGKEKEMHTV